MVPLEPLGSQLQAGGWRKGRREGNKGVEGCVEWRCTQCEVVLPSVVSRPSRKIVMGYFSAVYCTYKLTKSSIMEEC